jgi:hypothetical protein
LWNEECGCSDTWAVVVGERFEPETHDVEVIGWMAHPVRYDRDSDFYMGTETLGSYAAEREALAWAGLWHLGHNTKVDTIFRTDSLTSAHQAVGFTGCAERDLSFHLFRGIFQALETALSTGALEVEHIHTSNIVIYPLVN